MVTGAGGGDGVGMIEQLHADHTDNGDRHEDGAALLPARPPFCWRVRRVGNDGVGGIDGGNHIHAAILWSVRPTRMPVTLVTSVSICASLKPTEWKLWISDMGSANPR